MRGLPRADDHLTDAAHGLTIRRDDRERAHVVQDILGRDGFLADAAFGERDVLGDGFVQMVAHHQHVQMFLQRVDRIGPRRVGGTGQDVVFAHDLDDVRRVAPARTFGVKGVDRPALDRIDGVLDKAALVQGIRVDHHLNIHVIGHGQTAINRTGGRAPVFVQLHRAGTGIDHLDQGGGLAGVALGRQSKVHRERVQRLHHAADVPLPGRTGRGQRAVRGARTPAQHRGDTGMQRVVDLLGTDEMDVAVKTTGGDDPPLARDGLGPRTDDDVDARLGVGVTGLADLVDHTVLEADVGLIDTGRIHDQGVGNHRIHGPARTRDL